VTEKKELHRVRRFPAQEQRVETGPILFGDDWPGIFIRGDDAFRYTHALREAALDLKLGFLTRQVLLGLLDDLESSNCRNNDAFPAWHDDQ
jgi:hypothetical protein